MTTGQCPSGMGMCCVPMVPESQKFLCLKERREKEKHKPLLHHVAMGSDAIPRASQPTPGRTGQLGGPWEDPGTQLGGSCVPCFVP